MAAHQRIAKALAAITLASGGGFAALLSGSVPEFAIGLLLIGNAFLLLGALVWTSRVISISLGNSIGAAVTGEVGMPRMKVH